MVASVPELTMRSISMLGMISQTLFAIRVSISVGAPKLNPWSRAWCTLAITCGWQWPTIMGPHEPM